MELTISVITPSYNQDRFIGRTIQSVLSQGIPKLEYMICDGGSTDNTVATLKALGNQIKWVSEKDLGQADAVNKGIQRTSGDIIGWLNSDDIYYPNALTTVLSFLTTHPDVDVIYGEANHIDENDAILERYYTEDWNYERLKEVCYLCQPSVFFRRRLTERFGLLDASLRYCMDYEFWLHLGKEIEFVRIPQTLAGSRMYKDNKTLRYRSVVHTEINDMLKKRLGKTPTRWIYNYAFAVIDSRGYDRAVSREYVWILIGSLFLAYLRWRHFIPPSALRAALNWLIQAFRGPKGARLGLPDVMSKS